MKKAIQQFPPAYFALVMSTGILSLAAEELKMHGLAEGFFYVNLVAYPLLVLLLVLRIVLDFKGVWAELTSHAKGPNFLTLVPATCLVGNQFVQLRHNAAVGGARWVAARLAWVILGYSLLLGVSIRKEKPNLEQGFTGSWLLLVVATEALAVLGAKLVPTYFIYVALLAWLLAFGGLLMHFLAPAKPAKPPA